MLAQLSVLRQLPASARVVAVGQTLADFAALTAEDWASCDVLLNCGVGANAGTKAHLQVGGTAWEDHERHHAPMHCLALPIWRRPARWRGSIRARLMSDVQDTAPQPRPPPPPATTSPQLPPAPAAPPIIPRP
jgi:hypothetical protein